MTRQGPGRAKIKPAYYFFKNFNISFKSLIPGLSSLSGTLIFPGISGDRKKYLKTEL
jgi:hypothetical protein